MAEKKARIVFVEDDKDLCEGWLDIFEYLDYELKIYQKALPALADIETIGKYDLLITDFYLPDLNGVELLKRLRESLPDMPALILTGSREKGITAEARTIPHCKIVYKPVGIDELEASIKSLLNSRVEARAAI
jgi:DNA-binding response OmpR family regulator